MLCLKPFVLKAHTRLEVGALHPFPCALSVSVESSKEVLWEGVEVRKVGECEIWEREIREAERELVQVGVEGVGTGQE